MDKYKNIADKFAKASKLILHQALDNRCVLTDVVKEYDELIEQENSEEPPRLQDFLKPMPNLNRKQQEQFALTIRGLVYAFESRDDNMSHIPGHPGGMAYLNYKMSEAAKLMKEFNIEKV